MNYTIFAAVCVGFRGRLFSLAPAQFSRLMRTDDGLEFFYTFNAKLGELSTVKLKRSLIGNLGVRAAANLLYVAGRVPGLSTEINLGFSIFAAASAAEVPKCRGSVPLWR